MSADEIRITDLANPVLREIEIQTMASVPEVELSVDALLNAANAATGLTNFGANDFRERLAVWMQSLNEDTGLNKMGRYSAFDSILRFASNRLKIEDLVAKHPDILDVKIDRPIIIAGLPRSGTTHLVNVLASNPDLRSMQLWETNEPVPQPDEMTWENAEANPRYRRSNQVWHVMNNVLQYWSAMHEWAPGHVNEEVELHCFDFSSYMIDWFARVPRWQQYYFAHDQTPHYAYARKVIQIMTWYQGPNRWVMKSPQNMENLIPLHSVYPDATIVITHRDPVAVIQSALTMMAYLDRIRRDQKDMDLPGLAAYWINRIEHLLQGCVNDHDKLPKDQVVDVLFHEYMADQRGTINSIYQTANLPMTAAAEKQIDLYLNDNPRGKRGRVIYDLHGDFGVDVAALRKRFQFYYDRFPVEHELTAGE